MPDTPSITIVKALTYRGKREEVSNKYHFSGTTPSSTAAWKDLADAIIDVEKTFMHDKVKFVRAYGYAAGNNLSVAQIDYEASPLTPKAGTQIGGQNATSAYAQPESSLNMRWRTANRNSRSKWVYLRKYYHGFLVRGDGETLEASTRTAAIAAAAKFKDGTLPGGFKVCGPQGAAAGDAGVDDFAGTRELKRRGKRPN